jgi:hypothetical protein
VIDELDGRLLPGAATPEEVDGVRIAYDPATGTLALPEGLHSGLAYTVHSRALKPDANLLPLAEVPSGNAVSRFLALPGTVPPHISALAQQLGSGVSSPYQRALAIEEFLSQHYTLVPDAPSGHAYPNLDYFLFGARNAGGQRGTSEQFAAAFAVLGRALGLPTRVAVGFQVKAGQNSVRGSDALAWPEVLFTELGWVDFSPFPLPNTSPRPVEEDFRPKPDPSTPPPTVVPPPSASASPRRSSPPAAAPPPRDRRWIGPALAAAGGTAGAVLAGFLVAVPLLRTALRRRRLSHADPAQRVAGAWAELLDGLRMAGRPALPHLTASEVAAFATAAAGRSAHVRGRPAVRLPAPPVDDLAALANTVAFAPSGGIGAPPGVAAARVGIAVAQADAYVGELRARRPWWRRLAWTFDPRPLWWARRRLR